MHVPTDPWIKETPFKAYSLISGLFLELSPYFSSSGEKAKLANFLILAKNVTIFCASLTVLVYIKILQSAAFLHQSIAIYFVRKKHTKTMFSKVPLECFFQESFLPPERLFYDGTGSVNLSIKLHGSHSDFYLYYNLLPC